MRSDGVRDELPERVPGTLAIVFAAFAAGAGALALELTGARLFMPWFGASVPVWANVIGVTLGAIAIGNYLGGRIAHRGAGWRALVVLLMAAASLVATAPYLVSWAGSHYLPTDLELASGYRLLARASLLCALIALAPALAVLGAVAPILIRFAAAGRSVGRAAGLVSASGTLGSLVGTFVPVYASIPTIGSRATCFAMAALLAIAALVVAVRRPRGRSLALAALFSASGLGVASAICERSVGHPGVAGAVREEFESKYQYGRVEDDGSRVILKLDEGLDSFHSMTIKGSTLTGGSYFDHYNFFVPLVARSAGGPTRVLILGFAAGTIAREMLAIFGESANLEITGVEIDPCVAALGPRWFELPSSDRIHLLTDIDARSYVECSRAEFDLVIVDVYAQQVYVPFQTCSVEFFRAVRARLVNGGILAANLSGFSTRDASIEAITATCAAAFGTVGLLKVANERNFVLTATRDRALPEPEDLIRSAPPILAELAASVSRPGAWAVRDSRTSDRVLTDDRSDIELRCDRDLAERAARLGLAANPANSR